MSDVTNGTEIKLEEVKGLPRVLSIQSHVVSGYVGNKCAVFPLQVLEFDVDFINSVQLSNHTGYGVFPGQILEDSDLDNLLSGLAVNELINYTHLLTGYVGSESFLKKIGEVVADVKVKNPGSIYLCDPVLGDRGEFYVPESLIPIYQKEILPKADITTPNTFELQHLSGCPVTSEPEAIEAMNVLHRLGVPIVVLTSLDDNGPQLTTYVSHKPNGKSSAQVYKQNVDRLNVNTFTGTGDLYSALFLAWFSKTNGDIQRTMELVGATMDTVLRRTLVKSQSHSQTSFISKMKSTELELIRSLDVIQNPPTSLSKAILVPQKY